MSHGEKELNVKHLYKADAKIQEHEPTVDSWLRKLADHPHSARLTLIYGVLYTVAMFILGRGST